MEEIMKLGIFQLNEVLCGIHSEYMNKLEKENDHMWHNVWNDANYFPMLEVEPHGLSLYIAQTLSKDFKYTFYADDEIISAYIRAVTYYDESNGWDFTMFPQAWTLSEMLRREYHKSNADWAKDPWFLSEEKYWEIRNRRAMHGRPERNK